MRPLRAIMAQVAASLVATLGTPFMNAGGVPYRISTETAPGAYDTDFTANAGGPVEWFEVYGEVQTRYSQVYWTRNAPIELPKEIVQRFAGKVMAITGYEVDQVVHDGPRVTARRGDPGPLSGFACYPECENGTDTSIPMYNACARPPAAQHPCTAPRLAPCAGTGPATPQKQF